MKSYKRSGIFVVLMVVGLLVSMCEISYGRLYGGLYGMYGGLLGGDAFGMVDASGHNYGRYNDYGANVSFMSEGINPYAKTMSTISSFGSETGLDSVFSPLDGRGTLTGDTTDSLMRIEPSNTLFPSLLE